MHNCLKREGSADCFRFGESGLDFIGRWKLFLGGPAGACPRGNDGQPTAFVLASPGWYFPWAGADSLVDKFQAFRVRSRKEMSPDSRQA